MITTAIISEYNPFHNGHLYHLKKAKKITNADYTVAIMSGNFLQRGMPAILDKYTRAGFATKGGVDLVLELPVLYACSSARDFALGAIIMLNKLGYVDYLAFGAEYPDLSLLEKIANIIVSEPDAYKTSLKTFLGEGCSYPSARTKALKNYFPTEDLDNITSKPNNTLAIEYLCALIKTRSSIKPVVIERKAADYNQTSMSGDICSATAIRKCLEDLYVEGSPFTHQYSSSGFSNISCFPDKALLEEKLLPYLPDSIGGDFIEKLLSCGPVFSSYLSPYLSYVLTMNENNMEKYLDFTYELANRSAKIDFRNSFDEIADSIKSKNTTLTRVNRALLHALLNITLEDMNRSKENGYIQYASILSFKKESARLLKILSQGELPIITKKANARKQLKDFGLWQFEKDAQATFFYNLLVYDHYGIRLPNEYQQNIIINS